MSFLEYEGWTNYPTWAVKLWIDNDQGLYNYRCSLVENTMQAPRGDDDSHLTDEELKVYALATLLTDWIESRIPETGDITRAPIEHGMFSDCLKWAIGMVDWRQIAQSYIQEYNLEHAGA